MRLKNKYNNDQYSNIVQNISAEKLSKLRKLNLLGVLPLKRKIQQQKCNLPIELLVFCIEDNNTID